MSNSNQLGYWVTTRDANGLRDEFVSVEEAKRIFSQGTRYGHLPEPYTRDKGKPKLPPWLRERIARMRIATRIAS